MTNKEKILELLKNGLSYVEIGRRIGISRQAVRVSALGYKNPKNAKYQKDWRERRKKIKQKRKYLDRKTDYGEV